MNTPSHMHVETVIPLSVEQTKELKSLLKKKFGSDSFKTSLNAALLGGIRVTVNSTQYDASVHGKLATLRIK